MASTLGVVVPPSPVLILLGDAMMRAHTEAANAAANAIGRIAGQMVRVINTQDVFRGALAPAGLFLLLCLILSWWSGRRRPVSNTAQVETAAVEPPLDIVGGPLAAVAAGYLYAVEAAAMGAVALLVFGLVSRSPAV